MIDPVLQFSFGILAFLWGSVLGSFGNVLIYRLPEGKAPRGRSHCPQCGYQLAIRDLVPLLSFAWLWGKCRKCHKPISWQYPLVELASGLLFMLAFLHHSESIIAGALLALCCWILLLIAVIDGRTGFIPDALTFPFIALALLRGFFLPHFPLLPLVLGCGFFGLQWIVSRGKWVGSGDILLGLGIGALTGSWSLLLIALFAAYILGATVASLLLINRSKRMNGTLSFGPFLCIGTYIAIFLGPWILKGLF